MEIVNPKDGSVAYVIEETTKAKLTAAFDHAKKIALAFRSQPYEQRAKAVDGFKQELVGQRQFLATVQCNSTGKPIRQCLSELDATIERVDYFLKATPKLLESKIVSSSDTSESISYEPLGVIANISAWNYPLFVGTNIFIPALLTGNCVLFKASEYCAPLGQYFEEFFIKAGLIPGAFQAITGGPDISAALLDLPLDGLFFTGSMKTGQSIASTLASKMIPQVFELGGKDPAYVRADADIKAAAASLADGSFYNAGQSCCGVERIYVDKAIYEAFVKEFIIHAKRLVIGDPLDESTSLGPLTRPQHKRFLDDQIADALSKGAKIVYQADVSAFGKESGYFAPCVLTDVNHDMKLMKEESFGPIIGIQKVRDDHEASRLMDDTEYGLTAAVYTRDLKAAEKILGQLDVGSAYINCCDRVSCHLPWSGRRLSGLGASLSEIGIRSFLKPKAWHSRPG